ncbi:tetratricopeptide repeat protein [Aurantimonas sp. E1-2-R+4]|uniref:tetratricopeptide repeat protein n=1 Tax=Aurantimonas sp. E1-2-R+4 TaxID=3113714 RepID=UPI002F9364C8
MIRNFTAIILVLLIPFGTAHAQLLSKPSTGTNADAPDTRTKLFVALKAATSDVEGRAAEAAIWRFWMRAAPDSTTRRLVDDAMSRRGNYDFAGARELLDEAITRSPTYAEAFNQRGFIRFLQEDFDGALEDVDRAIALEPYHFGAMAGRAHILMRQGRFRLAQAQLRAAVAIHPFLKERAMLAPPVDAAPEKPPDGGIDL